MYASVQVYVFFLVVILTGNDNQAQNITAMQPKDVRAFLSDRSFVVRQINCVLGKAECDRLGSQLKKIIPEVVNRKCARCTPGQAGNVKKLIHFIQNNYPVAYTEILNKYRRVRTGATKLQLPKITRKSTKVLSPQSVPTNATAKVTASRWSNISSPQLTPKPVVASSTIRAGP